MSDEDRINVEYDVESYQKQPDGSIVVITTDGTRLRLLPDGSTDVLGETNWKSKKIPRR